MDKNQIENIIKQSIQKTMGIKKDVPVKKIVTETVKTVLDKGKTLVEALILTPKTWILKTEYLSGRAKEAHLSLYKKELDCYNKTSIQLDSANRDEADPNGSVFKSLKVIETNTKNSVMLHELYFSNISDLTSEIHMDSLPYLRLARDFGTFEDWQVDFRACCMVSADGWGMCYYDPYKKKYCNTFIEDDAENIPLGGIPVIVVDVHEHAYFRDYLDDKKAYINAMMAELNFQVVELRMVCAEKGDIHALFTVQPVINTMPDSIATDAKLSSNNYPIGVKPAGLNDQDQSTSPSIDTNDSLRK